MCQQQTVTIKSRSFGCFKVITDQGKTKIGVVLDLAFQILLLTNLKVDEENFKSTKKCEFFILVN